MRLLEKDPGKRPATAQMVVEALAGSSAGRPLTPNSGGIAVRGNGAGTAGLPDLFDPTSSSAAGSDPPVGARHASPGDAGSSPRGISTQNPVYRRARHLSQAPRELAPAPRWSEPVIPRHLPGGLTSGNFLWN